MSKSNFLLLGIPQNASLEDIKNAYSTLLKAIHAAETECTCGALKRLGEVREQLSRSMEGFGASEADGKEEPPESQEYCRPKLGQLLVATGLLTIEELDAALEIQANTKTKHIPLGELLMQAGYLTKQQLDYYLRLQDLMNLPSDRPERWGQRLVELGLVSEDQLKVALIEQKTTGCTLRQSLINRGWLTADILDRIF